MSKKLIAGAGVVASMAVALAPLATFAASVTQVTSHTDNLQLTIPQICTLGTVTAAGVPEDPSDATTHENGTGSWTNGATPSTNHVGRTDTLAATVYNGQAYSNLGTTTFTIRCNDSDGYTFSAQNGDATNGRLTHTTNSSFYIATNASGTLSSDDQSYWNFKFAVSNEYDGDDNPKGQEIATGYDDAIAVPTSSTTVVTGHGGGDGATGETITVTYGAGIDAFQESGVYEGSVVYTLADVDPQQP